MAQRPAAYLPIRGNIPLSRVSNADSFLLKWREIRQVYNDTFRTKIAELRAQYTETPQAGLLDESLEIHIREYVVNGILAALNWRHDQSPDDGLPTLFSEVPVHSQQNDTVRFLDYLGLEKRSNAPLLIVRPV